MTTNSMTCEVFADRLMAYLEDDTDATTRAARPPSPKIARLFASVAPLVKITSSGCAPSRAAIRSRA